MAKRGRKKKYGKKRKSAKRVRAGKRAYRKTGLYKYNLRRKRRKGKKYSRKKRGGKRRSYKRKGKYSKKKHGSKRSKKKYGILTYKAAAKAAAARKALHDRLVASGKPPAVVKAIMARVYRMSGSKKTKAKSDWFAKRRAAEAAERAEAYMRSNYGRAPSYN